MIKHIVFYKLNEEGLKNIDKITRNFKSMEGKIPGLISVECGKDYLNSQRSMDYALICTFSDKDSAESYKTHPVHLPVKAYMHTVVLESKSVDFEI